MLAFKRLRLNLWSKLVVFTAVIVVITCSTLSWFFVRHQAATLQQELLERGTLLAHHLAASSRYSVLVKDHIRVHEQILGLLDVDEVVYVMVRSANGEILDAVGRNGWELPALQPLALPSSADLPIVRRVALGGIPSPEVGPIDPPTNHLVKIVLGSASPTFYDVAVPVLSVAPEFDHDPNLSLTLKESSDLTADHVRKSRERYGIVHVGITDAEMLRLLPQLIGQAVTLTLIIIAGGLACVLLIAHHISTPVKALTSLASQVSRGNLSVITAPSSHNDEIGDLAVVFDGMVRSLAEREGELQELNRSLESRVANRTAELQRANSRLQELNRLKTTLVSTASHELRTPLTSMKVHLDNLIAGVSGPLNVDQADALRRVHMNMERLCHMVEEMLDLSHLQTGKVTLDLGPVRLDHLIHDVLLILNHFVAQKAFSIELAILEEASWIWGDEGKLRQVFSNLLHNAMKFTPAKGTVRVSSNLSPEGFVTVCVADSGCGMACSEVDKVFLPFYRCSNGKATGGSGLGLSIVKELVELHGGSVRVESTVEKGSQFFIQLPRAPNAHLSVHPAYKST